MAVERPLAHESDVAVAFALGQLSQMPPSKRPTGLLAALAVELGDRRLFDTLLSTMGDDVREALKLAIGLDYSRAARPPRPGAR